MSFRNAIIDSILLVVQKEPAFTLGQLCDPDVVGFDLRDVLLTRLTGANVTTKELVVDLSCVPSKAKPTISTHRAKTAKKSDQKNFDAAVLSALMSDFEDWEGYSSEWASGEVIKHLDAQGHGVANSNQILASMKRLQSRKHVKRSGIKNGTRYAATAKGVKEFEKMGAA